MKTWSFSKFLAAAVATVLLTLSPAAGALEIAPYFHAWGPGTLMEAKRDAGLTGASIAFGVTRGSCVLDGDLIGRLPDAKTFVANGGTVLLSFGGSSGTYVEVACTNEDQFFGVMDKVIADSGIRRLDWDVEGHQLLDTNATARRARVLARLQAKYPNLFVSFTLPGWLLGLDKNSMALLRTTRDANVRIDRVNVMAMSFGWDPMVPNNQAQAVITTLRASAGQLMTVFPGKSQEQIHAMMGVTPMIGKNDDGRTFTVADARAVADFVKVNGLGMIGYWSFQRDRASTWANTDLGQYSGVVQSQFEYLKAFQTAVSTTSTPAPAPTPTPAPSACSSPSWVQGKQYAAGSIVTYSGSQYLAKFANPGWNPTISTYYWSRYDCATAPAPVPVCSSSNWVMYKQYPAGSIVTYGGLRYIAKFANPGYNPTISTYFWSRYFC